MEMNQSLAADIPDGSTSLRGNHPRGLLDTLTAVRWDLKCVLLQGEPCPRELTSNIGRVFDDLDASIDKLRELIYERGLRV